MTGLDPKETAKPITARGRASWAAIVEARLAETGRTPKSLAAALGISTRRHRRQLDGREDVTLDEAIASLEMLGVTYRVATRSGVVPSVEDKTDGDQGR